MDKVTKGVVVGRGEEKKEKNSHDKVKKKKLCRKLRVHPIQTGRRGMNNLGGMSAGLKQ